jgi:lactoylglutathione lyase
VSLNLNISRIQHVGIPTTNLPRSKAFYEGLGFSDVMSSTFEHHGGRGVVAMMQQGDILVELYQIPEDFLEEIRTRKNGHIDHIAFDVDDINKAFAMMKDGGYLIEEDQPVFLAFWKNGCKYFNVIGPDGERLEFNQIL